MDDKTLHVLIDTAVLRADPARKKAGFVALQNLCHSGRVALSLPRIVVEEFVSQQTSELVESTQKLATQIKRVSRSAYPVIAELDAWQQRTEEATAAVPDLVRSAFDEWLKDVHARVIEIDPSHGPRVMTAYFSGAPPFKKPKSREDIPDGFIWAAAVDLSAESPIHLVSHDGGFREAADEVDDVEWHSSLDDLIASPPFQHAVNADRAAKRVAKVMEILNSDSSTIDAQLFDLVDAHTQGESVSHYSIPDDNQEAIISGSYGLDDVEVDWSHPEYYGGGVVGVEFTGVLEATLSYAIFKADYWGMPESQGSRISISDLNDHYFDAEEEYSVRVRGRLVMELDEACLHSDDEITQGDLEDAISDAELSIDAIHELQVVERDELSDHPSQ